MFGQDLPLQQCPLRVVGAEVLFGHPVDGGSLGAPPAGEDAASPHDRIRVHAVDTNAVLAELGGEKANLVGLVGLGGTVGHVVRTSEHCVLRRDVHDVAAHALVDHRLCRGARDEEAALGHHVVLTVPIRFGCLEQRRRDRHPRIVDDEVDPAEREQRRLDCRVHTFGVSHVDLDPDRDIVLADLFRRSRWVRRLQIGHDHTRSLRRQPARDGPADPSGCAGHEGNASGVTGRPRQALQLRLLKRPVLNAELLGLGNRRVGRNGLRTAHDVDRVDIELTSHPRRLLVSPVREHSDAGDEHDGGVGTSYGRRVGRGMKFVVSAVGLSVFLVELADALDALVDRRLRRQV